ncbi:MAG TPA: RNA polymerase sporulation sigma factor SigE [Candidatus Scatomorpha intestinavium]|uniref:RNA polymerase sigma factor n=1 Tax=Candidatus Scatomorpha intestinavium TaxID=2840922 RepID=A0A9D0ZE07_9FIRM|nr:RNA polymerase sporulation sigma factor SigE [Candidatus Scatomorpha intestinavium]
MRSKLLFRLRLALGRALAKFGVVPPEIYYIGGSDTLPAPLPRAEEEAAIAALERGDEDARQLLVEHNLRLVVYIARRFENTGINLEDLVSIGAIGLIKAVNTFKSSKNIKLATYASRCIENEILMFLRKSGSQRTEVSLDEPLNTDYDGNELLLSDILGTDADEVIRPLEDDAEAEMLMAAIATLGERERRIVLMRFGFLDGMEYTQKEVADLLGISQSYISRLEKRIIARLRKEMVKQMQV